VIDYKCKKCGEPLENYDEDGIHVVKGCKPCLEREAQVSKEDTPYTEAGSDEICSDQSWS